jgi:S-adenosylmethionine:tRNA ribosyltransferase-isomerase
MRLSDFDFELPERLIATRPAQPRSASRLLYATSNVIEDHRVTDLVHLLRKGDRLVLNNTKVIPARLNGVRIRHSDQGETRAKVEVTLLSPTPDGHWRALAKPGKRLKTGERVEFGDDLWAEVLDKPEGEVLLEFNLAADKFDKALAKVGMMPLPPYIASLRAVDAQDNLDYQTVFAKISGAVAAPTASLHFDDALLARLANIGVTMSEVTLHVGAGTFLPVKVDDVSNHKMHSEWGQVSAQAATEINATKAAGGRIIAVGTTALRLIESATDTSGQVQTYQGETDIFIKPGYRFRVIDGLMTNFHLPKSTLLMLVSALMGQRRIRQVYAHAIAEDYRFYSYGDSSLLLP